ncbi:ComEA family DNA-binding protein [Neolewinella litorea]|uniref:ComEA family DNA-binding protein n=1 Tax=Neolewinella litorea TaxID=2562452 RepID=UPI0014562588|nr:helix-hairpin-helix domain-containing protein [Neolewinella litorea]
MDQLIEDVVAQQAEEGGEFTFNAAFDVLEAYARRPLDLNAATAEELGSLYLLSPLQIDRLLAYREALGRFISIYELQAVPGLDLETIRRLLPYVKVGTGLDDVSVPLSTLLTQGTREVYIRAGRRLERARGYTPPNPAYAGSPLRLYTKYRQRYGNQLSLGVVAEKDPGEPFFRGGRGFDFYSAHLFLRNLDRRVRAVALGDFTVSMGQGLILFTGFGFGKSSYTTSVARTSPTLQPYASVNEFNFMRGAGTTLALGEDLELTLFGSHRRRTANPTRDSLGVTSLNLSGYHRTVGERMDRNALTQTSYGGSLRYRPTPRLHLGLNLLGEHLSRPLLPTPRPYNRFYFRGTDLQNVSLDYRYRLRNFSFFGEVAGAVGAGTAMLHGVNLGIDRRTDVAVVYRKYDRDYQALSAQPFGESGGGRNEEGLYVGLEVRPAARWRINAYYDLWHHDWVRYNLDAPTAGREYRLRLSYARKRKLDSYLEIRTETKGATLRSDQDDRLDAVVDRTRFQARLHAGYHLSPTLEWRSRLDMGFTRYAGTDARRGILLFQDLHYRPMGPLSFSARLAAFATPGYEVRFYEYENGLTYNAYVLPYYGEGVRGYLLLRYKGIRGLTLEARAARSQSTDGNTFGTGQEATGKTHRTDLSAQVIWRW